VDALAQLIEYVLFGSKAERDDLFLMLGGIGFSNLLHKGFGVVVRTPHPLRLKSTNHSSRMLQQIATNRDHTRQLHQNEHLLSVLKPSFLTTFRQTFLCEEKCLTEPPTTRLKDTDVLSAGTRDTASTHLSVRPVARGNRIKIVRI